VGAQLVEQTDAKGSRASPAEVSTYARQAEEILRNLILSGAFTPGQRLAEVELSRKLAMSRSPIREALQVLANEGLVRIVPNRGAFVMRLEPQRIEELYEVREALEVEAVRLAAVRAEAVALSTLHFLLKATSLALEGKAGRAYPGDLDFHAQVVRLARNPALAKLVRDIDLQLRLARGRSGFDPERAKIALADHFAIYQAVAAHEPDRAEAAMRRHLRASLVNVLEVLRAAAAANEAGD
jgi:DNA-binding GntR family transcriptional regulator